MAAFERDLLQRGWHRAGEEDGVCLLTTARSRSSSGVWADLQKDMPGWGRAEPSTRTCGAEGWSDPHCRILVVSFQER